MRNCCVHVKYERTVRDWQCHGALLARHVTAVLALNAYFNASRGQPRSYLRAILVIQATFLQLPCRPVTGKMR